MTKSLNSLSLGIVFSVTIVSNSINFTSVKFSGKAESQVSFNAVYNKNEAI